MDNKELEDKLKMRSDNELKWQQVHSYPGIRSSTSSRPMPAGFSFPSADVEASGSISSLSAGPLRFFFFFILLGSTNASRSVSILATVDQR